MEEINKQDDITADIEDMLLMVPTPIPPIFNVMIYAGRFCFAGHPEYTQLLEIMLEDARKRNERRSSGTEIRQRKAAGVHVLY